MYNYKVVIVEDEIPNSRMLQGMIKSLRPDWQVVAILESVSESVEYFRSNESPDLIFMDIQLTDGISFSIFEKVEPESLVIFTTAYNEYAIQAFKVKSIDYLLKPIKEEELLTAISKFELAMEMFTGNAERSQPDFSELINLIKDGEKKYKNRFLISGVKDYFKVDIKDVAYFYTENRVTHLVTYNGKEHIIDFTMEKLEEQLNPEIFFRANRSHILNIDSVRRFENYFGGKLIVKLINPLDIKVEVSRLKASEFKQWMDN